MQLLLRHLSGVFAVWQCGEVVDVMELVFAAGWWSEGHSDVASDGRQL